MLYNRIQNLSTQQRQLLRKQLKQMKKTDNKPTDKERLQLIAYIQSTEYIDTSDLKNSLKNQLPDYMIPAHIVMVDDFPRLPNGKIDQKSLPDLYELETTETSEYVAPSGDIEQKLVTIWEAILDFTPIGVRDNFFEIGGDSILSIQIVAKARQQGIVLVANQLFEYQTIRELALFAQTEIKQQTQQNIIETSKINLTPIQHWFFEKHKIAPEFWNQAILWIPTTPIRSDIAKKAVQILLERHDALRLNFDKKNEKWQATIQKPDTIATFKSYKITKEKKVEVIEEILKKEQATFNLSEPCLFKSIYLEEEFAFANSILFISHHLLVDSVSWTVLLTDFAAICNQLIKKEAIEWSPISNSFKKWSEALITFGKNKGIKDYNFWKNQVASTTKLPADFDIKLPITEENIIHLPLIIDKITTTQLLKNTSSVYNTKTEDLLIVALLRTIQNWTGSNQLSIGLEKHGREVVEGIEVSNTIGWFTAFFPLTFNLGGSQEIGNHIKLVKEKLRSVPNGGISYGVLRYLENDFIEGNELNYQPSIIFNYLGNIDSVNHSLGKVKLINHDLRHPKTERYYELEVNCYISKGQLEMIWGFSNHFKQTTIKAQITVFKQHLKSIINHCSQLKNSEYTPSDFPEADLNQDDLDSLMNLFE